MYFKYFQDLSKQAHNIRDSKSLFNKPDLHTEYISLDLSRQWLDSNTENILINHAHYAQFDRWRQALIAGEIVNITEEQAATHMYCRLAWCPTISKNIPFIRNDLLHTHQNHIQKSLAFADQFRAGQLIGSSGKILTHYVHLGIGGSDLGPRCILQALDGLNGLDTCDTVSFVSNLDPEEFTKVVRHLNPETTLFGIASKSFNTLETKANAQLAKEWLKKGLNIDNETDISQHFCAMTASPDKASHFLQFNTQQTNTRIFLIPNTVGGRYSLWSVIGLSIAIAFGSKVFIDLCEGASNTDEHFFNTPFSKNLPAQLGAIQVWNATALGLRCQPTIAYSHRLGLLPAHLQQLDMESNGKSTGRDGLPLNYPTSPALLAGIGTPAQHAFFQWFHQGIDDTASLFIGVKPKQCLSEDINNHYTNAVTACLYAQADVLWKGGHLKNSKAFGNHGTYPGGRPVSILMLNTLNPHTIGALIAIFEHAVYTAAILWGINPFDQWGVELGKQLYAKKQSL